LRVLAKGALVTYAELSRVTGHAVTSRDSHLSSARRILKRDHGAVWDCERPGVGVKRLNDREIAEKLPQYWLNGARNKLKKGGIEADAVETSKLNVNEQARFGVDCLQQHLATDALSRASRRRLERVARGSSNDLPALTAIDWITALTSRRRR
jgi:hypothetical protein